MSKLQLSLATAAQVSADLKTLKGVASTFNNVDRMKRSFIAGAFGEKAFQVPLLLFHEDTRPVGSSILTPTTAGLDHHSTIVKGGDISLWDGGPNLNDLVKVGGIPATSIGWIDQGSYLEADIRYFERVDVVENSLCPVPANPLALLSAASMLGREDQARAMLEDMMELAVGRRNSNADQAFIQTAHDALVSAGASCLDPSDDNAASIRGLAGRAAKIIAAVRGSYEHRQDLLLDAIGKFYPADDTDLSILATYDDRVVYEVEGGGMDGTYQVTYAIDDNDAVQLGMPMPVSVDEVVTPRSMSQLAADIALAEIALFTY